MPMGFLSLFTITLEMPYFIKRFSTYNIGSLAATVIIFFVIILETLIGLEDNDDEDSCVRNISTRSVFVIIPCSNPLSGFMMMTELIRCFFMICAHSCTELSLVSVNNFLGLNSFARTDFIDLVPNP